MPLDLAHLARRLSSSYQPSGAQLYPLEASFQTVLEAEQRIYGICERAGIRLEEDALPLRENTLPLWEERAELLRQESPRFSPSSYISVFTLALTGTIGGFYTYNTLAQEGKLVEATIGGMTVLLTCGFAALAYGVLGIAEKLRREEYFILKKEMTGSP